jgi:hypothetical protein
MTAPAMVAAAKKARISQKASFFIECPIQAVRVDPYRDFVRSMLTMF